MQKRPYSLWSWKYLLFGPFLQKKYTKLVYLILTIAKLQRFQWGVCFSTAVWHFSLLNLTFRVFLFFFFLLPLWHMEVPRLCIKSELPLPAYATAIATSDPICICDLQHSSRQHCILNPLSRARDQTHKLMVPSRIHFLCATMGTSSFYPQQYKRKQLDVKNVDLNDYIYV